MKRSKTAEAKLQAKIEAVAALTARERALLALRLGRELRAIVKRVRHS